MTPLSDNRNTRERAGRCFEPLILDGEIMYAGGIGAVLNSSGECEMASDKANLIVLGRVEGYVDNTDDGLRSKIKAGVFKWANSSGNPVTTSHLKQVCYVEDDQTVSSDPGTNGVIAGAVVEVDSDGVWVDTTNNVPAVPSAAAVTGPAAMASITASAPAATASDITDNGGGSDPGDQTIPAFTNTDTLTDSTGGSADDTLDAVTQQAGGSGVELTDGDPAKINNNFKEIADQLATQKSFNTAVMNALSLISAEYNTLKDDVEANNTAIDAAIVDLGAAKTAVDANNTAIDSIIANMKAAKLMKTS